MKQFTLGKSERLKSRKRISEVYADGEKEHIFPLLMIFLVSESEDAHPQAKCGFVVSKRRFKRAVDRNMIKRRMREAYRKNKFILIDRIDSKYSVDLLLVYIANVKVSYHQIEHATKQLLDRLLEKGELLND